MIQSLSSMIPDGGSLALPCLWNLTRLNGRYKPERPQETSSHTRDNGLDEVLMMAWDPVSLSRRHPPAAALWVGLHADTDGHGLRKLQH